ncbi:MAG: hypothetical protein QNK23_18905 [Crocinitomicaceae bacterium]|nr:hypothetical protein [Crocinitomicaceae bacterium]
MKIKLTTAGLAVATMFMVASCGSGDADTTGTEGEGTETTAEADGVDGKLDAYEAAIDAYVAATDRDQPAIDAMDDEIWSDDVSDDRIDELYEEMEAMEDALYKLGEVAMDMSINLEMYDMNDEQTKRFADLDDELNEYY